MSDQVAKWLHTKVENIFEAFLCEYDVEKNRR